jgi:RNA polymerase sigma-70 factor (ECF subfamily)
MTGPPRLAAPPAARAPTPAPTVEPAIVDMTAEQLAVAAQRGRRDCFELLAQRMRPRLHAFLRGKTARAEDADDLAQETLLRACDRLDQYDPRWRFSTWLFTIGAHLAADHFRTARRTTPVAEPGDLASSADQVGAGDRFADRDAGRRLWQAARRALSERDYRLLWLRYADDLPVEDIAAQLGLRAAHVKVLLFRARRRLAAEVR